MKAFLIATALILSSSLRAQESVPADLLAYTDPPASIDRYSKLLDTALDADRTLALTTPVVSSTATWVNSELLVMAPWQPGSNNATEAASGRSAWVMSSSLPTTEDALTNLKNTLNSSDYVYYDYFLEDGGLRLPLSW
jgi:hypothetical protein